MERKTFYSMKGSENDGYYLKQDMAKRQLIDYVAKLEVELSKFETNQGIKTVKGAK